MGKNYRADLFERYNETHGINLDGDIDKKRIWFTDYFDENYRPNIGKVKISNVLDVGCNKGFLLSVMGDHYPSAELVGIDLDEQDLKIAKNMNPTATLVHSDLSKFVSNCSEKFDLITCKAVLEHIPKDEIFTFLEDLKTLMKPNAILLLDVPNMAWLFAGHERYMDFTHEVGFTKESLMQVLNASGFRSEIISVDHARYRSKKGRVYQKLCRRFMTFLLMGCDPEGASNDIFCRSILAKVTL